MTTPQGMLADAIAFIEAAAGEMFALFALTPAVAPDGEGEAIMPSGRVHKLKTWPRYFEAILSGKKQFECRVDDRRFAVGDTLILQEWQPVRENYSCKEGHYTGREIERVVTFLFSTQPTNERVVVMSLAALALAQEPGEDKR